jgi:hypothetical protein
VLSDNGPSARNSPLFQARGESRSDKAGNYAIIGPGWKGALPAGVVQPAGLIDTVCLCSGLSAHRDQRNRRWLLPVVFGRSRTTGLPHACVTEL